MMIYHGKMMNVQWTAIQYTDGVPFDYISGHKEARHACAGIALEADAEIAALKARIAELEQTICEVWYGHDEWITMNGTDDLAEKLEAIVARVEAANARGRKPESEAN